MPLKIKGDSFAGRYKRVNDYPIDSTDVWDTIEDARVYARNTDTEPYVPYAGQVLSVLENGGTYKLVKDESIPETDGKKHFKLAIIGSNNDNDDRYVRKDIAETIEKLMTFIEGINVKGTATLNEIILLKDIISKNFAAGSSGFGITQDSDGNYHLDIDFVDIRKKLNVNEIQVQQSTYIGGKQYNTNGGIICNKVEDTGDAYRCYFKTTDAEGRTVRNTFKVGDFAISETFALKTGTTFYWRYVSGCGDDYIDISKTDCAYGSDMPSVGDNIVQLGNRTDTTRQGAIIWDSVTSGGPYVRIYKGINSYTMPKPLIDFNTVLSEITAKFINQATGESLEDIVNGLQEAFDLVKAQVDKEYALWFFDYDPTLDNIPSNEWTTDELKAMHEQDMFYNRASGYAYRFEKNGDGSYSWNNITDQQTIRALEKAAKAQDTADGKRTVFVERPTDEQSYDVGDQWVNATCEDGAVAYKNDLLVCKTAKKAGEPFSISHWQPSSTVTTAYLENLGNQILAAVTDSAAGIAAAKELASKGIDDAYNALQAALGAQETADENTAAIQVTNKSIAALVEGIHFGVDGNITNIDTSGLVTTDDFNVLLSKKVSFDAGGHITNIDKSGLVTASDFAELFAEKAAADGYVKKAYIDLFVTELPNGTFQSNAVVNADQIRFNGNIVANDTFFVDEAGNLTLNDITANNVTLNNVTANSGTFTGRINASSISLKEIQSGGKLTDGAYLYAGTFTAPSLKKGEIMKIEWGTPITTRVPIYMNIIAENSDVIIVYEDQMYSSVKFECNGMTGTIIGRVDSDGRTVWWISTKS